MIATIWRFRKLSFYPLLGAIVLNVLTLCFCIYVIHQYGGYHNYSVETSYLETLHNLPWQQHRDVLVENGYQLHTQDQDSEQGESLYLLDSPNSTDMRVSIRIRPDAAEIQQGYTFSMRVRYKSFWARLWNQPKEQQFILTMKSSTYDILIEDSHETKDYPERIYQRIDALAELFPSDTQS